MFVSISSPDRFDPGARVSSNEAPRPLSNHRSRADRIFRGLMTGAAFCTLLIMGLIAIFLLKGAFPAIKKAGTSFASTFEWDPDGSGVFGIAAMLFGTIAAAAIAVVIAVPVSVGTALFINEYAPAKLRRTLLTLVDLLAAIPSLIFGIWGLAVLQPALNGPSKWLAHWLRFIPIFNTKMPIFGSSLFVSGVVLAIMIVPIIASIASSVMAEVPRSYCEAALALGGTRAGMIRTVIMPFSKGGLIGASMLGLGRALGETIAISLILSNDFRIPHNILSPGGSSIAATIALKFGEAGALGRSALMAAGLVLFVVTLLVNSAARSIVSRSKKSAKALKTTKRSRASKPSRGAQQPSTSGVSK